MPKPIPPARRNALTSAPPPKIAIVIATPKDEKPKPKAGKK